MNITVIPGSELAPADQTAWADLLRDRPELDSPFLRPEFMQEVAAVRDDVEVGVMRDGEPVGYLPYQRKGNIANPIAVGLCDLQAVITRPQCRWDPGDLLNGCDLAAWRFDHLLKTDKALEPYHVVTVGSPCVELTGDFAEYKEGRRAAGSKVVKRTGQRRRKLEREQGPVRFEFHSPNAAVLDALIQWKSEQCKRTKVANIFDLKWPTRLLHNIVQRQTDDFAGVLSSLYVNDKLAAVHMGIRSRTVLHWWFTAYGPEFQTYSPGLILLMELLKTCSATGIRRVDLGKGDPRYKASVMTSAVPIAEGCVDLRSFSQPLWSMWLRTRNWVRSSRFRNSAHQINRALLSTRLRLGMKS